jgi:hypothetical protein
MRASFSESSQHSAETRHMSAFARRCQAIPNGAFARRQTQHHGPPTAVQRLADHLDLAPMVDGVKHIVGLDEVHPPLRVELEERIVVLLSSGKRCSWRPRRLSGAELAPSGRQPITSVIYWRASPTAYCCAMPIS